MDILSGAVRLIVDVRQTGPTSIALLEGDAGEDILDLLERDFSGERSYELEDRLSKSDIPSAFFSC